MTSTRKSIFAVSAAAFFTSCLVAQSFASGDLYLYNRTTLGTSNSSGAVTRVDPLTGAAATVAPLPGSLRDGGAMAWDSHRGCLVLCAKFSSSSTDFDTFLLDAAGNSQSLGYPGQEVHAFAPTGDGTIYHRINNAPQGWIHYYDAAGTRHPLLEAGASSERFRLIPGVAAVAIRTMLYHAPTHSLVVAATSNTFLCDGSASIGAAFYRIPLSADGTRVAGAVTCAEIDITTSIELPVGISDLPNGNVLITIQSFALTPAARLVELDPSTMAISTFATSDYPVPTTTSAGTYSTQLSRAVTLDGTNDVFRIFDSGDIGPGGILIPVGAPVSDATTGGDRATLVEVGTRTCNGCFETYGAGHPGSGNTIPAIGARGCPEDGEQVEITVSSALGGAPAAFLVGVTRISFPFLDGTVLVAPFTSVPAMTSGTPATPGEGQLSLPLLLGAAGTFDFQAFVLDSGASQGLAMSRGLEMVVAP